MNRFKVGQIVNHSTFGDAMVLSLEANEIARCYFFNKTIGEKNILSSFLSSSNSRYTIKDLLINGAIEQLFNANTKRKAKSYANNETIFNINLEDDHLSAGVSGTIDYNVRFTLENNILKTKCDCPVGEKCKHQAALAMHLGRTLRGDEDTSDYYDDSYFELLDKEVDNELKLSTTSYTKDELIEVFDTLSRLIKLSVEDFIDCLKDIEKTNRNSTLLRAIITNDHFYNIIKANILKLPKIYTELVKSHKNYYVSYYTKKANLRFSDEIVDKALLYDLFNFNFNDLSVTVIEAKKNKTWNIIVNYFSEFFYNYLAKSVYYKAIGNDRTKLREIYENFRSKDNQRQFYIRFESELMQTGVVNNDVTIKDKLDFVLSYSDRVMVMRSYGMIAPLAIKQGEIDLVIELTLKIINRFNNSFTYNELQILDNVLKGNKDFALLLKIIKEERIYGRK